ncbi:pilus assembly PilX N-terminal domain-containing protein [Rhodoferax sp.]|uniref:pilus assembly PilX family protein n=1 Tax=Rhodoferax sp. TaxID=50421 RepID=UPI002605895F|nr:pilus assembly PilX N-terminal domain-containing protein [Rhodoferax sp.]MDD2919239.1 pilus assembly PilX N-terminal domain-containing protein [Rhodoferax sp.]
MKTESKLSTLGVQRGVALPVALIMLMVLMIGAAGMIRTIDTAVLVSGNMAFKHSATLAADQGIAAASTWLASQTSAALRNTNAARGYCSSLHSQDLGDNDNRSDWIPEQNWTAACTPVALPTDSAGNTVDYLIHRLCIRPDSAPDESSTPLQRCSRAAGSAAGSAETSSHRSNRELIGSAVVNVAYRITVRVRSPRGTRSFVQATVIIPV